MHLVGVALQVQGHGSDPLLAMFQGLVTEKGRLVPGFWRGEWRRVAEMDTNELFESKRFSWCFGHDRDKNMDGASGITRSISTKGGGTPPGDGPRYHRYQRTANHRGSAPGRIGVPPRWSIQSQSERRSGHHGVVGWLMTPTAWLRYPSVEPPGWILWAMDLAQSVCFRPESCGLGQCQVPYPELACSQPGVSPLIHQPRV